MRRGRSIEDWFARSDVDVVSRRLQKLRRWGSFAAELNTRSSLLSSMNSWHQTRLLKVTGRNLQLARTSGKAQYALLPFLSWSGISWAGAGVEQFRKPTAGRA